MTKQTI